MYEIIIVGGDRRGWPQRYIRRGKELTLDDRQRYRGQVNWTSGVENYLGYQFIEGRDLIAKFQQQVEQFPITKKIGAKVKEIKKIEGGFEVVCESGETYQGKVVLLASGKRPRRLNVEGEMELTGAASLIARSATVRSLPGRKWRSSAAVIRRSRRRWIW